MRAVYRKTYDFPARADVENVPNSPPISGRFIRSRRPGPDSAKRHGNPVRRTGYRNMCEIPVPEEGVTYRSKNRAKPGGQSKHLRTQP